MEINLHAERPAVDARLLPELVDAYLVDARLRVKTGTVEGYDYLLSLFLEWWASFGESTDYVLDVRGWAIFESWLTERRSGQSKQPLTLNTRRKCLSICRQLFKWAYRWGFLDRDFTGDIPTAKGASTLRTLPDMDDLRRLMAAAGQRYRPVRDQALVAVLVGTGVRRAEAAGLDVEDVEFRADGGGLLRVRHAKLGKSRTVVFDAICGGYLQALIKELGRATGPLFTGWNDARLSTKGVYVVIKVACRAAGIDERGRGPHDLRRMFATDWARNRRGMWDGKLLGMQLGHAGEQMTGRYVRQNLADLQQGFESPLDRL